MPQFETRVAIAMNLCLAQFGMEASSGVAHTTAAIAIAFLTIPFFARTGRARAQDNRSARAGGGESVDRLSADRLLARDSQLVENWHQLGGTSRRSCT
jgi:hypothetical protein